jgi:hypothetical protein
MIIQTARLPTVDGCRIHNVDCKICGDTDIINETWLLPVIDTTNIFAVRLQGIKFVPSLSWVCKHMQKLYIRPAFIKTSLLFFPDLHMPSRFKGLLLAKVCAIVQ